MKIKTASPSDDEPIIKSLSKPVKTTRGWTLVVLTTQGDKVLEREVVCPPTSYNDVVSRLQLHVINWLMSPARGS